MPNQKESPFLNLIINIAIPVFILTKFSSSDSLGPLWGLIVALSFPILYGIYDIIILKKTNILSIVGVISIILTGSMGILQLDPKWIALKEAAIPLVIGIVVLALSNTKYSVLELLLKQVIDMNKVKTLTKDKKALNHNIQVTTYIIAFSFLVSSILNYILAKVILKSPPGTESFNQELAQMTALSFPVIAIPSMIILTAGIMYLIHNIKKITHTDLEEIIINHK